MNLLKNLLLIIGLSLSGLSFAKGGASKSVHQEISRTDAEISNIKRECARRKAQIKRLKREKREAGKSLSSDSFRTRSQKRRKRALERKVLRLAKNLENLQRAHDRACEAEKREILELQEYLFIFMKEHSLLFKADEKAEDDLILDKDFLRRLVEPLSKKTRKTKRFSLDLKAAYKIAKYLDSKGSVAGFWELVCREYKGNFSADFAPCTEEEIKKKLAEDKTNEYGLFFKYLSKDRYRELESSRDYLGLCLKLKLFFQYLHMDEYIEPLVQYLAAYARIYENRNCSNVFLKFNLEGEDFVRGPVWWSPYMRSLSPEEKVKVIEKLSAFSLEEIRKRIALANDLMKIKERAPDHVNDWDNFYSPDAIKARDRFVEVAKKFQFTDALWKKRFIPADFSDDFGSVKFCVRRSWVNYQDINQASWDDYVLPDLFIQKRVREYRATLEREDADNWQKPMEEMLVCIYSRHPDKGVIERAFDYACSLSPEDLAEAQEVE